MTSELIGGNYRILGELRDAHRPGIRLVHAVRTGELALMGLPGTGGAGPTADELRHEGSVFGEIMSAHVASVADWNPDVPFLVWEYVAAWPLTAALRHAPPPDLAGAVGLMRDMALALAAVHARGALYRGLDPSKVLVMRDGSARLATTPHAVLAGKGQSVEVPPPSDTPVRYLSPEQIDGVIDARSDIYSLGAVSYEILTGEPLWADVDPVTQAVQIQSSSPLPPSSLRGDLVGEVDDLFARLLDRNPSARPATALQLVDELEELMEGAVAPDSEPLATYLSALPVVSPLLAEDAEEGVIYSALQADVEIAPASDADAQPAPVRPARPAYRSAATRTTSAELVDDNREGRLIGPAGEVFPLVGARCVIGRSGAGFTPDVDVGELDTNKVVSREHAVLDFGEGRWYVSELRARNGTWLNGERVRKGSFLRMRRGDQLKIANIVLSYTVADRAETAVRPQLVDA